MGAKNYQECFAERHRVSGIFASSVPVFSSPLCAEGTYDRLSGLVSGYTPWEAVCVLTLGGLGA